MPVEPDQTITMRILKGARRLSQSNREIWSMSDLVEEAGVSRSSLYRRFSSREAVLEALARQSPGDEIFDVPSVRERALDALGRLVRQKGLATTTLEEVELAKLRSNPELMGSAIEEMLRFDGPLLTTDPYYARETMSLHDVTIPAGATVLPALLSANRDEEVFEAPGRLDITRSSNKHLAFGKGIHHCLGAPLARLEAKVAFSTLLELVLDRSEDD